MVTSIRAQGNPIESSLVDDTMVETAKGILQRAKTKHKTIFLPIDAICSSTFPKGDMLKDDCHTFDLVVGGGAIDDGWIGLDE